MSFSVGSGSPVWMAKRATTTCASSTTGKAAPTPKSWPPAEPCSTAACVARPLPAPTRGGETGSRSLRTSATVTHSIARSPTSPPRMPTKTTATTTRSSTPSNQDASTQSPASSYPTTVPPSTVPPDGVAFASALQVVDDACLNLVTGRIRPHTEVCPVVDPENLRVRYLLERVLTVFDVHVGVGGAVHDQRRRCDRRQPEVADLRKLPHSTELCGDTPI